MASNVASIG